jgi:hypothetical protein
LIEVLFAFSVLSLIIIGALSIMNQGSIASQRSLETTLVRQEIDGQATTLRFLHDAYVAVYRPDTTYDPTTPAGKWQALSDDLSATTPTSLTGLTECPATPPSGSFILDPTTAAYSGLNTRMVRSQTFAQLTYTSTGVFRQAEGIWIEGILPSGNETDPNKQNVRYIDFHINACWDSPGQGPPMTIGTIVRLYEPRG